ncbi:MAG: hypothetical protein EOO09_02805 [Chitinophagaceae bacterium]|nr:MAG: hypothetical protein EOO09_02805 [Chitinophagaceae bacterium]
MYKPTILLALFAIACNNKPSGPAVAEVKTGNRLPLEGTWQLIDGTLIEKGDTTVTDYTRRQSFIKIINATHFAFQHHDLSKGRDSASFGAGAGTYQLAGDQYTEHLEYCSDRQWEGNDFSFTITISNDTLVQRGIEKIESAGVDRLNIERYVRYKK